MRVDLDANEGTEGTPRAGESGHVPGRTQRREISPPAQITRGLGGDTLSEKREPAEPVAEIAEEGDLRRVEPGPEQVPRDPAMILYEVWLPGAAGIFTIEAEGYTIDKGGRMMSFYIGGDPKAQFKIPEGTWYGIAIRSA